jgi:hypothetical protein
MKDQTLLSSKWDRAEKASAMETGAPIAIRGIICTPST